MQRILSAFVWLSGLTKKYSGLVALFGFCTGLFSLWQVERREEFAQFFAILMVVGWLWLTGEYWLRKGLLHKFGISLSKDITHLITQLLHQETLFFALPFFLAATDWDQPQAFFTLLLLCCALVAVIDPAYNRLLTKQRALFLLYHCFSLFAVLMVVLPLLFFMTTTQSLGLALIISALLSIPSIRPLLAQPGRWRLPVLSLLLVVMATSIWFSRSLIPAPVLNLNDIRLSQHMDYAQRLPGAAITELSQAELKRGLYAYTSVRAPRGLKEQIYHEWIHNGQSIERIPLNISGGREGGYRAWTRKQQFPQDAVGKWKIRVVTDSGQLLGAIRFTVTP
ncbi:DUF5924 family protein [Rheinheimera sp.]|uniref:DUF5924 family protein n=1 Tax=Rheinheimera sp. TaxID=1869214 RepID=UPI00261FEE30|nr:DUF5924 family protein [Rheinheimera sp.]MCA1930522.1 DUF2914 domain-containing protein [Rheinheimera sp.]